MEQIKTPDVIICAPPIQMMSLCISEGDTRTRGRAVRSKTEKKVHVGFNQSRLIDFYSEEIRKEEEDQLTRLGADNFHHLLKAKAMGINIPTQFVLPSTLDSLLSETEVKGMQDFATFSWNLSMALLYKAGARLWKPANLPNDTCFVGVSFYRLKEVHGGGVGTSLAQVFTPEGDGLVIKGERFKWDRKESPHLTEEMSEKLLRKTLDLYQRQVGDVKPKRVVIHKTSLFNEEEIKGFKKALEGIQRSDFVAILRKAREITMFREGYNPVLRGTMVILPDRSWLLYTKAYAPFLKLYPGPHIPRPLEILQHIGDSLPETISEEIIALTKLNWNNADYASYLPITLQFARQVGRIMREIPKSEDVQTKYMYYM